MNCEQPAVMLKILILAFTLVCRPAEIVCQNNQEDLLSRKAQRVRRALAYAFPVIIRGTVSWP